MAFQASAPPLPGYEPLPASEKGKPSTSDPGHQEYHAPSPHHPQNHNALHSFISPVPPQPLRGFLADPPPAPPSGYVADLHRSSGFVADPHHPHHHPSGFATVDPRRHHHAHPQHSPYPPPPDSIVFGFPLQPPPSPPHWNTRLCGCCSDPVVCCLGCCCPCILFGKIAQDLDEGTTSCVAACTIWYLLQQFTLCGWIYSHGYRDKLRTRYGLTRHPCCDCIVHFCCWHCAFCQEYREIQIRRIKDEAMWERHAPMAPPPQQVMHF